MKIKLTYFFRKKNPNFHSIETLFANIQSALPSEIEYKNINIPFHQGFFGRMKNIFFVKKHISQINHITGDVNYIALGLPKKTTLLTIHDIGSALSGNFFKKFIIKYFWFKIPFRRVKHIAVISEFTKKEIIKSFKINDSKITVIPNCISAEYFKDFHKVENEKTTILFIGTKANKNLELSIVALNGLPIKLIIIGKLKDEQKKLLEQNQIDYHNYFNISNNELLNLYRNSDILLFPSFYEGFGLPIVEAQAMGIPVITSNLEPMKTIAADAAMLVNPKNVKQIKESVEEIISNQQLKEELVQKGRLNAQKYSPQTIAQQYVDLYKRILYEQ